MSRRKVHTKQHIALAHNENGQLITGQGSEETHEYDDSPLPSPDELEKLHRLNADIIPWLMRRAEDEQTSRHARLHRREDVLQAVYINEVHITRSALHWAGVLFLVGLGLSAFLIHSGQTIAGSIFGAGVLVSAVALFIKRSGSGSRVSQSARASDADRR